MGIKFFILSKVNQGWFGCCCEGNAAVPPRCAEEAEAAAAAAAIATAAPKRAVPVWGIALAEAVVTGGQPLPITHFSSSSFSSATTSSSTQDAIVEKLNFLAFFAGDFFGDSAAGANEGCFCFGFIQ